MSRLRWVLIFLGVCVAVGVVVAVSVSAGGGGAPAPAQPASRSTSQATTSASSGQAAKEAGGGSQSEGPPYPPIKDIEPAKMISAYACEFVTPEEFWPVNNGWKVADRRRTTLVCAGGAGQGADKSIGRFLILRTDDTQGTQHLSKVDVSGAGPLNITQAPLGPNVVTSSQTHGNLEFKGQAGVTGTLHLQDDTVSLNP